MAEDSVIKVTLKQWKYTPPTGVDRRYFPRVELGGTVLLEGERFSLEDKEGICIAVDLLINVDTSSPSTITNLVQYPLLISFLEVIPKDKKQKEKEERTNIIGQASLDLLPYLLVYPSSCPSPQSTCILPLHPCDPQDVVREDKSSVEVDVDTSKIDSKDIKMFENSNVLSLYVRSMHCLPENWQPGSFEFTAALPLPRSTPPKGVTITKGQIKPPRSQDQTSCHTHWFWPGKIVAPDAKKAVKMQPRPLEEEVGVRNLKSDLEFRQTSESDQPSVVWNMRKRVWLLPDDVTSLLISLSSSSCWPLEVGRYTVPGSGGGGGGGGGGAKSARSNKDAEPTLIQQAVAYLNLSPLVYPGCTKICGAFCLNSYSAGEVLKQTGHSFGSLISPSGPPDEAPSAPTIASTKKLSVRALHSSAKIGADAGEEGGGDGGSGPEDTQTYIYLEMELHKPLVLRREVEELTNRVKDYIVTRPPLPLREGGAEQAVLHFQQQASSIATQLVTELKDLNEGNVARKPSKEPTGTLGEEDPEERRLKFLYHLNSSGKYYSIKEQIKRSVVKIVREKYLNQVPMEDDVKYQQFLSELYVFLVDQMHIGLRKVLSIEGAVPSVASPLTSDLLKHFAFEAESAGDYELTHRYHKERISRCGYSAEVWYDYAVFCLLASLHDRCEQCLKEAISIDPTMTSALLLYGMVCCLDDKYEQAEDLFEMATTYEPNNIIAWTMRGLYYQHAGNKVFKDMCFQEAQTLNTKHQPKTFLKQTKSHPIAGQVATHSRVSVSSTKPVLGPNALKGPSTNSLKQLSVSTTGKGVREKTESVVSDDTQKDVESKASTTALPSLEVNTTPPQPHPPKEVEVMEDPHQESRMSMKSPLQDVGALSKRSPEPEEGRRHSLPSPSPSPSSPSTSIYLQTASYLLDVHALKFTDMALSHELANSFHTKPTSLYDTTVARLHMHREGYGMAKECLQKAIVKDIQDSTAWGLLGHTHYLMGEYSSAKDVYQRTLCFVNRPAHAHLVYTRLADVFFKEQNYPEARSTLLQACQESPSSLTWLGVGVACYRLGELQQAEDALSEANILNNQDPLIWAYLTMVCIMTNRPVEAEQALKFSIKTGLKDDDLIMEIRKLHQVHTPNTPLVHLPPLVSTWSSTHCTSPSPTLTSTTTQ